MCVCVLRMLCTNTAVYLNAKVGNKVTVTKVGKVGNKVTVTKQNNNIYYTS